MPTRPAVGERPTIPGRTDRPTWASRFVGAVVTPTNHHRAHPVSASPATTTPAVIGTHDGVQHSENPCRTEPLIIDEADRLKTNGLEQLRDFFDRHDLGVILIGMPGFDRQLARYPQLYSRIGFAHQYKPLDPEDIPAVLTHYGQQLGLHDTNLDPDGELVGTIVRITGGNFRLIERLITQVGRLMDINGFDDISPDLITAARQTLVIGTQ